MELWGSDTFCNTECYPYINTNGNTDYNTKFNAEYHVKCFKNPNEDTYSK